MIVIDASVAVKLVISEPDSDAAEEWYFHEREDINAPDILAVEVGQAIVRRVNAREMSVISGEAAIAAWREILDGRGIDLKRTSPTQVQAAARLAIAIGHPLKDCVYLGLAMDNGSALITSDHRFAAKARPIYPNVRVLGGAP